MFDRSSPISISPVTALNTALAGTYDHQIGGHRYRLRQFVSVRRRRAPHARRRTDTAAPEQLPDLGRSLTGRQSGQAAPQASFMTCRVLLQNGL